MARCGAARPRVCLIATAMGDSPGVIDGWYTTAPFFGAARLSHLQLFPQPSVPNVRAHLMTQDVIFVWGGSVVNLLAVWRAHRLDEILADCWSAGVVLAGGGAGGPGRAPSRGPHPVRDTPHPGTHRPGPPPLRNRGPLHPPGHP